MEVEPLPVSVAIITLNEEERLADCLQSVGFASEVVIVDSGSTDRTQEIAVEHGACFYSVPWQGFGIQKQTAIDYCSSEWILVLDADERVSREAYDEIIDVLGSSESCAAYSLPRKNYFCGRWLKHAGWWPDRVVRLFRKGRAHMSSRLVHEALVVDGETGELTQPLIHFANRSLRQTLDKVNAYSSAGAEELFRKGVSSSVPKAFGRALWAFVANYFLNKGFLDGGEGFIMAISDCMNVFFKYAKLRELHRQSKRVA
ncbi:MAG: glycosyltransferase family 2 protein [Proteobacteria bacterium]|nr:glycosyltransferase family 2 protein [Pseudomonadota bacterium]MBU1739808.1 glycosyltransferase family 2 protein [Pseudomonadota bacterium]